MLKSTFFSFLGASDSAGWSGFEGVLDEASMSFSVDSLISSFAPTRAVSGFFTLGAAFFFAKIFFFGLIFGMAFFFGLGLGFDSSSSSSFSSGADPL